MNLFKRIVLLGTLSTTLALAYMNTEASTSSNKYQKMQKISGTHSIIKTTTFEDSIQISLNISADQFSGDYEGMYLAIGGNLFVDPISLNIDGKDLLTFSIDIDSSEYLLDGEPVSVIYGQDIWFCGTYQNTLTSTKEIIATR